MTLNQIIKRLRAIGLSHYQINSFFQGDPFEFDANGENEYGAMFVEILPGSIDRGQRKTIFKFNIYLLDLVGVSENTEENEQEVESDMLQVAHDLISWIGSDQWQDWELESADFSVVTESLNDMLAGVVLALTVSVDFVPDVCRIPRDTVITEDGFDLLTEQGDIFIEE